MYRSEGFGGHAATVAAAVLVAVVFMAGLAKVGGLILSGHDYRVRALVPSAQDVYPGATVRLAGLRVGRVEDVERRGRVALLTLGMEGKYAPVHRDARVEVRLHSVAGESYVELYPGSPDMPELPDSAVLPLSQAVQDVQIDEVLSVLDRPTRERAREMIRGLARGIGGRGTQVNDFVDGAAGVVDAAAPVARVLAQDRRQLARLIDGLGVVTSTIGRRRDEMRLLARQGRATAENLAARDDAVRALLEELPSTLGQVRRTTTTLREVTRVAAPVLSDTAGAVRNLKPAVRSLRPAAAEGRRVLTELERTAPQLERVLAELRRVAGPTADALPPLRATLCELNPLISYIEPYARDVGVHVANLASGTNFYNAEAHAARVHGVVSDSSPVIYDPATSGAADRLLSIGVLSRFRELGWNPYPEPGAIADVTTGTGATGPHDSGLPFERLAPSC